MEITMKKIIAGLLLVQLVGCASAPYKNPDVNDHFYSDMRDCNKRSLNLAISNDIPGYGSWWGRQYGGPLIRGGWKTQKQYFDSCMQRYGYILKD